MVWIWSYEVFVLFHIPGHQDPEGGTEDRISILGGAEATTYRASALISMMTLPLSEPRNSELRIL